MFRHVPNALTTARLVLAVVFFGMLSGYQYEGRGDPTLLNWAFIVYAVALFTDFLDGYLARKWQVEGAFGRLVDPFVDKILVLGSFAFFAGKNFIIPGSVPLDAAAQAAAGAQAASDVFVVRTITGVAPWIVVVLLARELLVTTFRGMSESGGASFGAMWAGKVKMVFQSITILVILAYVNYLHIWQQIPYDAARWVRDFFIWGTVAITLASSYTYLRKAVQMIMTPTATVPPPPATTPPMPTPPAASETSSSPATPSAAMRPPAAKAQP